MEPTKVKDPSQPIKITIFLAFFLVVVLFVVFGVVPWANKVENRISLGGALDQDLVASTTVSGSFTCGAASSIGLGAQSGRTWFRLTNDSTSTVYIGLVSSTVSALVTRTGIRLDPSTSTAATTAGGQGGMFDSGISGINWSNQIACIALATGSVVTFVQSY